MFMTWLKTQLAGGASPAMLKDMKIFQKVLFLLQRDPKPSFESISIIYTLYMEETLKLISCGEKKRNLFEADA